MKPDILDKFKGCLVGGAAGDALGYAVEFNSTDEIRKIYGKNGIAEYDLSNGKALISDDTQMTLFTSNGLLLGTALSKFRRKLKDYPSYIWQCYKDWLKTQNCSASQIQPSCSWLLNVPELCESRAPGGTCLWSLAQDNFGTIENPINNSKGCGGVMRVAPIGLYFIGKRISQHKVDMLGAEAAALTHGHELGYMPAALLVHIISLVANNKMTVEAAVQDGLQQVKQLFPHARYLNEFIDLINRAVLLSKSDMDDLEAIYQLGEGWVAEETLAIAIYCALKYQNDFEKALVAAVNHNGDSDSTGAVTGNILGAYSGLSKIPQKFITNLELEDLIEDVATDLYKGGKHRDEVWESKYVYHNFRLNK